MAMAVDKCTPITIEDVMKKEKLTFDNLDIECTEEDVLALYQFCDPWDLIGRHLRLPDDKLSAIKEDHTSTEQKRLTVMREWKQIYAFNATFLVFVKALLHCQKAHNASKVCQLLKQNHYQSEAVPISQTLEEVTTCTVGSVCEEVMTQSHPESNSGTQDSAYESQLEQSLLSVSDNKNVDGIDSGSPVNSQSTSPTPSVDPLFPPTKDRQILQKREKIMTQALTDKFKLESFRPRQKKAIKNILSGTSTLVVLPVGFGKSLCYQLPAYLYSQSKSHSPCITLVISPLVSLMEDQVHNCPTDLIVRCLHANQTKQQREKVLREIADKRINVLLLSPEALESGSFYGGSEIPLLQGQLPQVAFACIDEAHCISEWSHNFRHSYFRIQKVLRESLNVHCVLGLTATATHTTALSVADHLKIKEENIITSDTILPKNLHISVSEVDYSERDEALIELLLSEKFRKCESIIIYCTKRNQTDTVAEKLNEYFSKSVPRSANKSGKDDDTLTTSKHKKSTDGGSSSKRRRTDWTVASYHAGMLPFERKKVQDDFMSGRVRIVVATVAFGMGLNKADVRAIIHYNMPSSIELFVQEIGRAGRDGLPAYCHVFIDKEANDLYELRRFAYNNVVDPDALRKFVDKIFSPSQSTETHSLDLHLSHSSQSSTRRHVGHQVAISAKEMESLDIREDCTATLVCYLELQGWLEITNVIYTTCTLEWRGGPDQLRALGEKFLVVAAATAKLKEQGIKLDYSHKMTFSMREVAVSMGKELQDVYLELRRIKCSGEEPNEQEGNEATNTVLVEFSGRIFDVQFSRNFSPGERDATVITYLKQEMKKQEERAVEKVHLLHAVLQSEPPILETLVDQYFSREGLTAAYLGEHNISFVPPAPKMSSQEKKKTEEEIRDFLDRFKQEGPFTGTAVARIFYGIASPLFPYNKWKEAKRFWWKHLRKDFNELREIATRKLQ